ncbi:MAG: N-acetylmuramoyl-L-alanine amidase [Acetobacteraceae bacterium]|nr:N-acetylmuramoyl-L-alanine amidase [Acetobacteraceae bacterium]
MIHRTNLGRRAALAGLSLTFLLPSGLLPTGSPQAAGRRRTREKAAPLPMVVLDPGHGGKDPGAIGISGTYEKHVALAAAQELRRQLLATRRYRVELTRGRDVFIALERRVAIARRRGAALFVSMHADAMPDPGVRGASVYTLNETASDGQTAALAQRENASDRFGTPNFQDTPPEVARILVSLVRQETRTGSARMANSVVASLGREVKLLPNPARHASFMVLKAADIPSVLVELGFMSNRADEADLRRPAHRSKLARAMARAVDAYFAAGGERLTG